MAEPQGWVGTRLHEGGDWAGGMSWGGMEGGTPATYPRALLQEGVDSAGPACYLEWV